MDTLEIAGAAVVVVAVAAVAVTVVRARRKKAREQAGMNTPLEVVSPPTYGTSSSFAANNTSSVSHYDSSDTSSSLLDSALDGMLIIDAINRYNNPLEVEPPATRAESTSSNLDTDSSSNWSWKSDSEPSSSSWDSDSSSSSSSWDSSDD